MGCVRRMELSRLKREVLYRHADELEAVLGEAKMIAADDATTVARFHELITMQVCGDEPDDEMRYRCDNIARCKRPPKHLQIL